MRLLAAILCVMLNSNVACASPNFVVILTDDQEDTGSMAYMPKVHSLIAEHGVTFTNSFVNLPLCAPSRASFLTGQAAHNHGIRANSPLDKGGWEAFKAKEANALPVWLKAAGYKTALVGKYLNRYGQQSTFGAWLAWAGNYLNIEFKGTTIGNPRDWVPPGWDLWYAFTGMRAKYYDYSINENGTILDFGDEPTDYSTDVLKGRAVRFILDQLDAKEPFLLLIAPKAVHAEGARAIPSPKYEQAFKDVRFPMGRAFNEQDLRHKAMEAPRVGKESREELELSYRAALQSLQSVDDLVEAVVGVLAGGGKLDNTVIVYTSDNGFLFGDHRLIGKSAPYEGSIKVPLLMRGPGIPAHQTREQLVNNLDVVATILELAGAKPGVVLDGTSLLPLLHDGDAPWRSAILIESPTNRFQNPARRYTGVRTATRKYINYAGGDEKLFDLIADPDERKNKARRPSYRSDLSALRKLHGKLKSCAGVSCWVP
jgi:arylsulfatase A-like enzyme